MNIFNRKKDKAEYPQFDLEEWTPVIRSSICTGEKTACMRNKGTGRIREIMLIRSERDLEDFRRNYNISGGIETIY